MKSKYKNNKLNVLKIPRLTLYFENALHNSL